MNCSANQCESITPESGEVVRELTLLVPATSMAAPNDLPGHYSDVTVEQLRALKP